jgi:hypothetical protein
MNTDETWIKQMTEMNSESKHGLALNTVLYLV